MSKAKTLSPKEVNPQYEPLYKGDSAIDNLIEEINLALCLRANYQDIKNGKSVTLFFGGPKEEELMDLYEESIKSEYEYRGWHIRVVRMPRQPTVVVMKTSPFDINDTGSGGL